MNRKSIYIAGLTALALSACKPNLETDAPSAGNLDLTTYVAVGNSLTAGFADGSLYRSGQENSYPNMLAKQFGYVGGGAFRTPYLPGESGWPVAPGQGYLPKRVLSVTTDCKGVTGVGPVLYSQVDTAGSGANIGAVGPYNNTGIPGIRAIDYIWPSALPIAYSTLNPYARRIQLNPALPVINDINRANATFFTAWIGNNDVLGYATSGGAGKGSNGSWLDQSAISSTALFAVAVDSVLNRMTANGAKGAVMNIPDVTALPYFNTVPVNGLALSADQVAQLNAAYAGTGVSFTTGNNNFVIQDTTVPGTRFRLIHSGEYILLTVPQDSIKCAGWGSLKPIPTRYVLDAGEVANVRTATTAFNNILQQAAADRGLAYVDMNSYLKTLQSGILFNAVVFNSVFVSGGAFSLDGIYLTPRGYALAANEIIRVVNAFYGASIPRVDVNSYPGVRFP
jgi:hypothetical protein